MPFIVLDTDDSPVTEIDYTNVTDLQRWLEAHKHLTGWLHRSWHYKIELTSLEYYCLHHLQKVVTGYVFKMCWIETDQGQKPILLTKAATGKQTAEISPGNGDILIGIVPCGRPANPKYEEAGSRYIQWINTANGERLIDVNNLLSVANTSNLKFPWIIANNYHATNVYIHQASAGS